MDTMYLAIGIGLTILLLFILMSQVDTLRGRLALMEEDLRKVVKNTSMLKEPQWGALSEFSEYAPKALKEACLSADRYRELSDKIALRGADSQKALVAAEDAQKLYLLLAQAHVSEYSESRNQLSQLAYESLREASPQKHPSRDECRKVVSAVFDHLAEKDAVEFLTACREAAIS